MNVVYQRGRENQSSDQVTQQSQSQDKDLEHLAISDDHSRKLVLINKTIDAGVLL